MKLLLISNSTAAGQPYLGWCADHIRKFLGCVDSVAFIPYAAVTFSYDEYEARVQRRFDDFGIEVRSIHRSSDPAKTIREAEAIVVGGGNTFALLKKMHEQGLVEAVRMAVADLGVPYVGWSAGSNVACPTICTTNDMPIVEPSSLAAVGVVPFQINPHYLDAHPDGHAGETREQRIEEYIAANADRYVVGLREGCLLRVEDGICSSPEYAGLSVSTATDPSPDLDPYSAGNDRKGNAPAYKDSAGSVMELVGSHPARIFRSGTTAREVNPGADLSFLWD